MFKVSLLPESYRKQLIGKKNREIILSVSVIVLVCMLIIYVGIAVRLMMLKGQEKKVEAYSAQINKRIEELSPYVDDYNALAIAQAKVQFIKPVEITALEFITEIQKITPDYIKITALAAPEWQDNQICVIEGDLCSAVDLRSANSMLNGYVEVIQNDPLLKDAIKEIKVVNEMPFVNEGAGENGETTYSFRIIVSLSGAITIDDATGTLLTTETTETTTEATTEATTVAESTEPTSIEPSTIGTGAPTEATSDSTNETPTESTTGGTSNE